MCFSLHRRRQHWIEGNCKDNGKVTYCNPDEDMTEIDDNESSNEESAGILHLSINSMSIVQCY